MNIDTIKCLCPEFSVCVDIWRDGINIAAFRAVEALAEARQVLEDISRIRADYFILIDPKTGRYEQRFVETKAAQIARAALPTSPIHKVKEGF